MTLVRTVIFIKKSNKTTDEANIRLLKRQGKPNHILFIKLFADKMYHNWKLFFLL